MKLKKYLNEMVSSTTIGMRNTNDTEVLREAIMAEYDATNLYIQMSKQVRDPLVKKVLLETAQDEKEHIGKFETLLERLDVEHEPAEEEGEEEVEEIENEI